MRIGFMEALQPWQTLSRSQYEDLHDDGAARGLEDPDNGFVVEAVGDSSNTAFSDEGIEYYRFVG